MWATILTVVIIVLVIAAVALFFLYRFGSRVQAQNYEAQRTLENFAQVVPMLVIDKKRMKLKDAPFPPEVYEKTPLYLKWIKVYVTKVKIGSRVVNLMCERDVFDELPLKTTIQGTVSGLYLKDIKKGAVPTERTKAKRRKEREKIQKKAARAAK